MTLVESLKILLMEAGWNNNSRTHQQQSLVCRELVSEVPVRPGHPGSMPPLVWPPLLSELVHCAKNGVFPHSFLKFGYPGLAEGNVIDSHISLISPEAREGHLLSASVSSISFPGLYLMVTSYRCS